MARGDHLPGWWERVAVQLYRMALPPSGAAHVREYADGTIEVILSPGPASGELAGQAGAITGPGGAAIGARTIGAAAKAAAREVAEEVAETALQEATGLPLPGRARGGDTLRDPAPAETSRRPADTGPHAQPESLAEELPKRQPPPFQFPVSQDEITPPDRSSRWSRIRLILPRPTG